MAYVVMAKQRCTGVLEHHTTTVEQRIVGRVDELQHIVVGTQVDVDGCQAQLDRLQQICDKNTSTAADLNTTISNIQHQCDPIFTTSFNNNLDEKLKTVKEGFDVQLDELADRAKDVQSQLTVIEQQHSSDRGAVARLEQQMGTVDAQHTTHAATAANRLCCLEQQASVLIQRLDRVDALLDQKVSDGNAADGSLTTTRITEKIALLETKLEGCLGLAERIALLETKLQTSQHQVSEQLQQLNRLCDEHKSCCDGLTKLETECLASETTIRWLVEASQDISNTTSQLSQQLDIFETLLPERTCSIEEAFASKIDSLKTAFNNSIEQVDRCLQCFDRTCFGVGLK